MGPSILVVFTSLVFNNILTVLSISIVAVPRFGFNLLLIFKSSKAFSKLGLIKASL